MQNKTETTTGQEKEADLVVTKVSDIHGEYVEFDNNDSCVRYSADNWEWCIGESKETVFNCKELEEAYQLWKRKQ